MQFKRILTVVGSALVVSTLSVSSAFAQFKVDPVTTPVGVEQHCVGAANVGTAPQAENEQQPSAETLAVLEADATAGKGAPQARCFATFSEAIAAATGGAVTLSPNVTPQTLTQEMIQVPTANAIIGIMWQNNYFGGYSFTWTGNAYGCNYGYYYWAPTPPAGWNDVVSSAKSYNGCGKFYHYEHAYYGGAALACDTGYYCYSSYGTMNDSASSWRWWQGGYHY